MPVLGLLVLLASLAAPVSAAGTFTNKNDLQAALELVICDGDADALAQYGAPGTWDVSAVTDMAYLIYGLSCIATFDEVRTLHVARVDALSQWRMNRQPLMASSDRSAADCTSHRRSARGTSARSRT